MCLTGTFYQSVAHPFLIGDHIEVGELRGQVISRGLFSTKVLEIGPGNKTHQFTGRLVTVPNSHFLIQNVRNESYLQKFILHTFVIPTPYHVETNEVVKLLQKISESHVEKYYSDAQSYIERLQQKANLETPKIKARVIIKAHSHEEIHFVIRVAIPFTEKGTIQQAITQEFFSQKSQWIN